MKVKSLYLTSVVQVLQLRNWNLRKPTVRPLPLPSPSPPPLPLSVLRPMPALRIQKRIQNNTAVLFGESKTFGIKIVQWVTICWGKQLKGCAKELEPGVNSQTSLRVSIAGSLRNHDVYGLENVTCGHFAKENRLGDYRVIIS